MSHVSVVDSDRAARDDRAFLGHPKALGFIAFTEGWERFSFYGMQALLVLYMVKQLLQPGHIEKVAGFGGFHALLENVYGPLSGQALASTIFGLYTGMVYLTPILGGFLADRVLGRTATITLGAGLMALGHFLMAFDVTFLLALMCLVFGCGCFKGNLASQVGGLYAPEDLRRADAFQIYYLAINAGVIAAPLIVGTLGEKVAWHYGFGAAGAGMLIALTTYLLARRQLPADPPLRARDPTDRPRLEAAQIRTILVLIGLLPFLAIAIVGNQQIFNAYLVWIEANVELTFGGHTMPTTWMITFDSIASVSCLALVALFWLAWSLKFKEPDEATKIAIGCAVSVIGLLCLAAGSAIAAKTGGKVAIGWPIAFHVFNSIGFANVLPVGLALYARAAPRAITGTIIGVYYLHLFAGNNLTGWLGTLLEKMPAAQFWGLHAVMAGVGGLAVLGARLLFPDALSPRSN